MGIFLLRGTKKNKDKNLQSANHPQNLEENHQPKSQSLFCFRRTPFFEQIRHKSIAVISGLRCLFGASRPLSDFRFLLLSLTW